MQADTFYYPNGKYHSWRLSKKCETPTDHYYDSLVNQQYDKKGRPLTRTSRMYHEPDTAYLQYFDKKGVLLAEHHPVLMSELQIIKKQN